MSRSGDVFISYSRHDEDLARALKDRLRDAGISCFMDTAQIRAGDKWRHEISTALDTCHVLVAVCTTRSMASHEVTAEWAYAAGRGTAVIPVVYEAGIDLPAGLDIFHRLDFTDATRRQWDQLISRVMLERARNPVTGGVIRKAGIESIFFGRRELGSRISVSRILAEAAESSDLIVVGRSLESWSREFREVRHLCNLRNIRARFALVDPHLPREQWMIPSDYAQVDLEPSIDKLRRMAPLPTTSRGTFDLYVLPNAPLLSFTAFADALGPCGIVEFGAGLHFDERMGMLLRPGSQDTQDLLGALRTTFEQMLLERQPIFSLGHR